MATRIIYQQLVICYDVDTENELSNFSGNIRKLSKEMFFIIMKVYIKDKITTICQW